MNLVRSKRAGIVQDVFIAIIILFVFMAGLIFSYKIWLGFDEKIQDLDVGSASTKALISEIGGNWFKFLDKVLPFIFFVLWGSVILLSVLTNPDHPLFFFGAIGLTALLTFISFILVDVGTAIFDSPLLLSVSEVLGNTYFFLHNLHFISFFVMLGSAVFFWTKGNLGFERGVQR